MVRKSTHSLTLRQVRIFVSWTVSDVRTSYNVRWVARLSVITVCTCMCVYVCIYLECYCYSVCCNVHLKSVFLYVLVYFAVVNAVTHNLKAAACRKYFAVSDKRTHTHTYTHISYTMYKQSIISGSLSPRHGASSGCGWGKSLQYVG